MVNQKIYKAIQRKFKKNNLPKFPGLLETLITSCHLDRCQDSKTMEAMFHTSIIEKKGTLRRKNHMKFKLRGRNQEKT